MADQLPVKFDVGLKAEAKIDIKTEIPKTVMGRGVNALLDILSPISETAGLVGDRIRLQRLNVALRIAEIARELTDNHTGPLTQIPTKIIVPMIEKCSLEDEESEYINWWANLIAGAAKDKSNQNPVFIDFMSKIGEPEGRFLRKLFEYVDRNRFFNEHFDVHFKFYDIVQTHIAPLIEERSKGIGLFNRDESVAAERTEKFNNDIRPLISMFVKESTSYGLYILKIYIPSARAFGTFFPDADFEDTNRKEYEIISTCVAIGVLEYDYYNIDVNLGYIGENQCIIKLFKFSEVGRKFIGLCLGGEHG
jgi:hypothetical protein